MVSSSPSLTTLLGRADECAVLDRLVADVRRGESRSLLIHGEAGIGKTALLEYLVESASDLTIVRATGVELDMELDYAGLHELCGPVLDRRSRLPRPQLQALEIAFGLSTGAAPDRFLLGLAVLSLLSQVAEERPVICVVDDAHWWDQASALTLGFVTRRLLADAVGIVFAAREPVEDLKSLPNLEVHGLRNGDARALLGSAVASILDERVRDRILAETQGNPLALLELPRGLSHAELAGGFGLPGALSLSRRVEESFLRRLAMLPAEARLALLVAAAEPVGDPAVVRRAAGRLGLDLDAALEVESSGLLDLGARVRFRHPLVRTAIYRVASFDERMKVHSALAGATDPEVNPDRRAWHRAQAVLGPDEEVAAELEHLAERARARGGVAGAAAFLQRAAELSSDPELRARRALAGAQMKSLAGALDAALTLLDTAPPGGLDAHEQAQAHLLRAQIAYSQNHVGDAPELLLRAAKELEPLDIGLARESYRDAFYAALSAGRLARGAGVREVAEAIRFAPTGPEPAGTPELLLRGVAALRTEGYAAGAPMLRRALSELRAEETSSLAGFRWLQLASRVAHDVWDDESWYVISSRLIQLARDVGALTVLVHALRTAVVIQVFRGQFANARSLLEEAKTISEAMGVRKHAGSQLLMAAWGGQEARVRELAETNTSQLVERGEGQWLTTLDWATGVLYNGLSRYEEAMIAAERGSQYPQELGLSTWSIIEFVEAAARGGNTDHASDALDRLVEHTRASGTEWALGIQAYTRALASTGETAEGLYVEAIDRLGHTAFSAYAARAHLIYGEWLRREQRRVDARAHLHIAHNQFTRFEMTGFAERALNELRATGERARRRTLDTRDDLTAQERQIALLAREGMSNIDIAARLFLSPHTVAYHLRKVFSKLGISSRRELAAALPRSESELVPA
jgi:DNA-binding CsgD family transcriptional regulator